MSESRWLLASASPRRRSLLEGLGLQVEVHSADIDESVRPGESPETLVQRLALEKGREVRAKVAPSEARVLVAADTVVALGDEMLGKPADANEARQMLKSLSGRTHHVWTGIYLCRLDAADQEHSAAVATVVRFRELTDAWIDGYIATGEPFDKAGAYGIQERASLWVEEIRGSWSNVVGLPLERLPNALTAIGIEDPERWLLG